jgi:hypothetical protein
MIQIGFDTVVDPLMRTQFETFVRAHLQRRATPGTVQRERRYSCGQCGAPFSREQVKGALSHEKSSLVCPVDESRTALTDERGVEHDQQSMREMDASADAGRAAATASSVVRGKEETADFDVFLCHNVADKPAVRTLAARLRGRGLLAWLDEAELPPGRPWQIELERQIGHIRSAAVLIGPSGVGPWQSQEIMAFLREFVERGCPVIPVLLPGGVKPDLPLLLRGMTWIDLADPHGAGVDLLIWGITGAKPPPRA